MLGRPEIWVPVFINVWASVVDLLCGHRPDDTDVVGYRPYVRKLVADVLAGLAVGLEFVLGAEAL